MLSTVPRPDTDDGSSSTVLFVSAASELRCSGLAAPASRYQRYGILGPEILLFDISIQ